MILKKKPCLESLDRPLNLLFTMGFLYILVCSIASLQIASSGLAVISNYRVEISLQNCCLTVIAHLEFTTEDVVLRSMLVLVFKYILCW